MSLTFFPQRRLDDEKCGRLLQVFTGVLFIVFLTLPYVLHAQAARSRDSALVARAVADTLLGLVPADRRSRIAVTDDRALIELNELGTAALAQEIAGDFDLMLGRRMDRIPSSRNAQAERRRLTLTHDVTWTVTDAAIGRDIAVVNVTTFHLQAAPVCGWNSMDASYLVRRTGPVWKIVGIFSDTFSDGTCGYLNPVARPVSLP